MANVLIATTAAIKAATLAAGPSVPAMPVSNLKRRRPSDRLRLTDLTQAWIEVGLAEAVAVNVVALPYVSATVGAQWRIRGAAAQADLTAAPAYDSGMLPLAGGVAGERHRGGLVHALHFPAPPQALAWWRMDLDDPANPAGVIDVGALVIDAAFQPGRGISYGWQMALEDPSRKPKAADGGPSPISRTQYLAGQFSLDWLTEAEAWGEAFDVDSLAGTTEPVLVVRDPALTGKLLQRQTIYGLLRAGMPINNRHFGLYRKPYDIEELVP